ncbi:MAG TPA: DUF58 domain-containing protein [Sphingomicrobium sp.]|nr:DUF58 domain-containing protein [Sphingomicrobium sp.]
MIYPTRRAVIATAAGAPFALGIAAASPGRWVLGLAWPVAMLILCLIDAFRGIGSGSAKVELPRAAGVGETLELGVSVAIDSNPRPRQAEVALEEPRFLSIDNHGRREVPLEDGRGGAQIPMVLLRRGLARFERLWLRWTGPLGLVWQQGSVEIGKALAIGPDMRPVRQRGAQLFERHGYMGLIAQLERGDGSDFDTLLEFRPGMDRRSIDWKQSARHVKLFAKNYHSERNNQIVFVIDSGRQMSEPVAGMPRVDRAVSAMLLTGWVALKMGDRVALHAFDSRPRLASGVVSGSAAFEELKRISAEIDYSAEETNYSFGLITLSARLSRRSMIVLFTEFTDSISADFLVRAAHRLLETHLLLIVVLRDEELEAIAEQEPERPEDVTRAITAAALLKDRRLTINRLRHIGVHVVESEHDKVGERLVASYIELKQRNLL